VSRNGVGLVWFLLGRLDIVIPARCSAIWALSRLLFGATRFSSRAWGVYCLYWRPGWRSTFPIWVVTTTPTTQYLRPFVIHHIRYYIGFLNFCKWKILQLSSSSWDRKFWCFHVFCVQYSTHELSNFYPWSSTSIRWLVIVSFKFEDCRKSYTWSRNHAFHHYFPTSRLYYCYSVLAGLRKLTIATLKLQTAAGIRNNGNRLARSRNPKTPLLTDTVQDNI